MLELTATLDGLVARQLAARHSLHAAAIDEGSRLEDLRDRVEALEEVREL